MNIIFGNFGNQTIACIQWAFEKKLTDVYVISVDTHWEATGWLQRVTKAESFAKECGFTVVRLKSKPTFQGLIEDRGNFPSTKFQWCAGFLKGLPFNDWLDDHDPSAEAIILLGKRCADSRLNFDLPEFIEESEHFGDRKVWYPLYSHSDEAFHELLNRSGLEILKTRSLECDPCVNSFGSDLARLSKSDMEKTKRLEEKVNKHIFALPIEKMLEQVKNSEENSNKMFDMGCGAPFACGE